MTLTLYQQVQGFGEVRARAQQRAEEERRIKSEELAHITRSQDKIEKSLKILEDTVNSGVQETRDKLAEMDSNLNAALAKMKDPRDQVAVCISMEELNAVISEHVDRGRSSSEFTHSSLKKERQDLGQWAPLIEIGIFIWGRDRKEAL